MDIARDNYKDVAECLKVMSHPTRLCILRNLAAKGRCNVSYMQHCLQEPQATVSQHLSKLKMVGLIDCERKGKFVEYFVSDSRVAGLMNVLFGQNESAVVL